MKKFAAVLATALVMALSTVSVFAADSVTLNAKVEANVSGAETENTSVAAFSSNSLGVTLNDVKEDTLTAVRPLENVTSVDVVGVAEVTYSGTIPAEGVDITLKVDGINAGDHVLVIHYTSATAYEVLEGTAGAGTVTANFKSFSPVAIVKYTLASTSTDTTTPAPETESTPVAPKTGVLPVAAITAGICLAGAAVCGKKVKFN